MPSRIPPFAAAAVLALATLPLALSACGNPQDAYIPVEELQQPVVDPPPPEDPLMQDPLTQDPVTDPPPLDPSLPPNPEFPPVTDPDIPPADPTQVPPPSPEDPPMTTIPDPPPAS